MSIHAKSATDGGAAAAVSLAPGPTAQRAEQAEDVYFSVDIETDGPIPGPFSLSSLAIVSAGSFRGGRYMRPPTQESLYLELAPISNQFEPEALAVNRLDREKLAREGLDPKHAMKQASEWIAKRAGAGVPVLVAYPLCFDWSWLYWYFVRFTGASPFRHSRCFDLKTAIAVKGRRAIAESGHGHLPAKLKSNLPHTHNALDDARSQAEIFAKLMEWDGT